VLRPAAFAHHAPATAEEAAGLLGQFGDEAKVLAGGQSLIPMLSMRLAAFPHLVDIGRIGELAKIERDGDALGVGASTVDAAVGGCAEVSAAVPLLTLATPFIGHFQIRNRGTLGGAIAHADPAGEYPAVAVALDAEMEALSSRGRRRIPARDFFRGFWTTALAEDELLVAVRFPIWSGRCGFAVREFARRHGDFAVAGAMVGVELDADGRVRRCAISLFGLGPTPIRATTAEEEVIGRRGDGLGEELGGAAVAALADVPSDLHGSAGYRKRVGPAMVARAWDDAIGDASRG
jgi:carbon-monoxide dehydrogenase medium subunit